MKVRADELLIGEGPSSPSMKRSKGVSSATSVASYIWMEISKSVKLASAAGAADIPVGGGVPGGRPPMRP
jgi:hypothetical protein